MSDTSVRSWGIWTITNNRIKLSIDSSKLAYSRPKTNGYIKELQFTLFGNELVLEKFIKNKSFQRTEPTDKSIKRYFTKIKKVGKNVLLKQKSFNCR